MPILDDLSNIPAADEIEGWPPDSDPTIIGPIIDAWYAQYLADGLDELGMAVEGARWRASWSSMCARAVGYSVVHADAKRELAEMLAILNGDAPSDEEQVVLDGLAEAVVLSEQTNPPTIADAWRFTLGHAVHSIVQQVAAGVWPGAEAEVSVAIDDFGGAHVDLVVDEPQDDGSNFRTVTELKSTNGFSWKLQATNFKGAPEGPRRSAIVQGAVAAEALNADRLVIGVLSLELLSPDVAARAGVGELGRMAGQWTLTPDQFLPIAESERKRVRKILEIVDEGGLPPRHNPEMPAGARIIDPSTGAWSVIDDQGHVLRAGKHWSCRYCSWSDKCAADGPS